MTPSLAIDVREALRPHRAGKAQWSRGFVEELLRRARPVVAYTDVPLPDAWRLPHIREVLIPKRGLGWHLAVSRSLRTEETDAAVYVSPTSYIVPWLLGSAFPHVPVVHDLIAFRREPHDRKATWIERLLLRGAVMTARRVMAVSDHTREDLHAHVPGLSSSSIHVIHAGPLRPHAAPAKGGTDILCVATLSPRKNQWRLLRAYAELPDAVRAQHALRLVGARGWHDADIVELARRTPGASWHDYVDDAEYERLLATCEIFALPSLYEGFGMQVLDCLQRGIPLLLADRGSLKEVAGDAAVYVDPENVASIREGLWTLLNDPALRDSLRARGPERASAFSWSRTVDLFLDAVRDL